MTRWPRGDETFSLVLSTPIGATLPAPQATATIVANDQPAQATPVISVADLVVGGERRLCGVRGSAERAEQQHRHRLL